MFVVGFPCYWAEGSRDIHEVEVEALTEERLALVPKLIHPSRKQFAGRVSAPERVAHAL